MDVEGKKVQVPLLEDGTSGGGSGSATQSLSLCPSFMYAVWLLVEGKGVGIKRLKRAHEKLKSWGTSK